MQYRTFGSIHDCVSALGFGAMRFPTRSDGSIDEQTAVDMIRTAIDGGVNYVDTAYPYHGGESERIVGKALENGYREKVLLADKLPIWMVKKREDFPLILETQLERLTDEHIDLYLIHALNGERWKKTKELGILEEAERARSEGKIGHIGFSFHDEYEVFSRIIDEYPGWEFCQIQFNLMDVSYQAGEKGLRKAAGRGIPVVVMEPLKGGLLAQPPAASVAPLWQEFSTGRDHIDLSLRYIWNRPEVSTVLSGMSTPEQVRANLESASRWHTGSVSEEEEELYRRIREGYRALKSIDCTGCGYCLPCPQGVQIPRIFELYNDSYRYGTTDQTSRVYLNVLEDEQRADNCISCGTCEEACPQNLPIIEELQKAHELLTGQKML